MTTFFRARVRLDGTLLCLSAPLGWVDAVIHACMYRSRCQEGERVDILVDSPRLHLQYVQLVGAVPVPDDQSQCTCSVCPVRVKMRRVAIRLKNLIDHRTASGGKFLAPQTLELFNFLDIELQRLYVDFRLALQHLTEADHV